MKNAKAILTGIVLLALVLRVWGLNYNLADSVIQPDEEQVVVRALRFGWGDLNPHWFLYPTLYLYLIFCCYVIYFWIGYVLGVFPSTEAFGLSFFQAPTFFYLIPRILSTLLGTATVLLVYWTAKRLAGNKKVALLSAFFLAISLYHITDSHSAKPDIAMLFLTMLSFLFCFMFYENGKIYYSILAGFFAGLSVSTKYPGGMIIVPVFIAHLMHPDYKWNNKIRLLISSSSFAITGFFIGTPYAALDPTTFWQWFTWVRQQTHIVWRGNPYSSGQFVYPIYFFHAWPQSSGVLLYVTSILGIWILLKKNPRYALLLGLFPLFYILFMGNSSHVNMNFFTPCVPFLAIFAGVAVNDLGHRIRPAWSPLAVVVLAVVVALPSLYLTSKTLYKYTTSSTTQVAKTWIELNVPDGDKVLLINVYPSLNPSRGQIDEVLQNKIKDLNMMKGFEGEYTGRGLYYQYLKNNEKKPSYYVIYIPNSLKEFDEVIHEFNFDIYTEFDFIILGTISEFGHESDIAPATLLNVTPEIRRKITDQYQKFIHAIRERCSREMIIDQWQPQLLGHSNWMQSFFFHIWGRPGEKIEVFKVPKTKL